MFLNKHYEIPFAKECVTPFYLVNQDSPQDCIGQPETSHRLHNVIREELRLLSNKSSHYESDLSL